MTADCPKCVTAFEDQPVSLEFITVKTSKVEISELQIHITNVMDRIQPVVSLDHPQLEILYRSPLGIYFCNCTLYLNPSLLLLYLNYWLVAMHAICLLIGIIMLVKSISNASL